jgi:hypothetical protein
VQLRAARARWRCRSSMREDTMTSLDRLSLASIPIAPFFNDTPLPHATGFVWKRGDSYYLITNWHVASAKHLFSKAPLLKSAARPNRFDCHFNYRVGDFGWERIPVPVRDENDDPLWLIHPLQERQPVDIVAIRLDLGLKDKVARLPLNDLASAKLAIKIGMDVFILGYPFGLDLVKMNDRYYLVDTASRPGMSGSPVILRSWSNHILESINFTVDAETNQRPIDRVIGIYSGRTDDLPGEAQIGMVWHADYIDEIIDGGCRDR